MTDRSLPEEFARPEFAVDDAAVGRAAEVLATLRVSIFIVAFEAELFIASVLDRIPARLRDLFAEILIIDDSSRDATVEAAQRAAEQMGFRNLVILRTPDNRGYGGNQKLGYLHAIEQSVDYVVLLHGDGQYAPEYLPQILNALAVDRPDALIASRMIHRGDALRGGMPLYKWLGNQVLTQIQNRALGSNLSEFHSGYRAYKVDALRSIPFELNSDEFHFDTEVLIQLLSTGRVVKEIPVPTFYGDEISRVNGFRYAANCLKSVAKARLGSAGIFYEPKFDFGTFDESGYRVKQAENSLHYEILARPWPAHWSVADLGASRGVLSAELARRVDHVTSADVVAPTDAGLAEAIALDLDGDIVGALGPRRYDCVLALDVLEHLRSPEDGVRKIAEILKPHGRLYASTGNIAFHVMRLSLVLGQFNYGKRGILDLTHTRLFTISSFKQLLVNGGFIVKEVHGYGPPIRDMIGEGPFLRATDSSSGLLARLWPRLFAFSFLVVAEKADELADVYARTLPPPAAPRQTGRTGAGVPPAPSPGSSPSDTESRSG